MKLSLVIILFAAFSSFGQEPEAAIELIEHNVLHRGYKNRIAVAVTNNEGGNPSIRCSNCDTAYWVESNEFVVVPGKARVTRIDVSLNYQDTTILVKKFDYRVANLPDPSVYWGSAKSGKKGSIESRLVQVKYSPEIPLNAEFVILKWTFLVNGESVSGIGIDERHANLWPAGDLIKSIKEGDKVVIEVEVKGPDGVLRNLVGLFHL